MVIALIMAGGKGTRLKTNEEKPLLDINGKPMIQYVIDALKSSTRIDHIIAATSKNTPETSLYLQNKNIETILTSGEDYIHDLGTVLSKYSQSDVLLTITADIPLISAEIIDQVIACYEKSRKPAMSVMVPEYIFSEYGLKPTTIIDNLVPSGLNILRGINKTQNEEVLILEKIELALNINTCEDIKLLSKLEGD